MIERQQAMIERVDELERMVVRLNGRIGQLQRELKHKQVAPFFTRQWASVHPTNTQMASGSLFGLLAATAFLVGCTANV